MKTTRLTVFLAGLCLASPSLWAGETLKDKAAAETLCENIMQQVSASRYKEGLTLAQPYMLTPIEEQEKNISKLEEHGTALEKSLGKSIGWEKVSETAAGTSLMTFTYLQKMERHPLVWQFVFYKPKDTWVLNTYHLNRSLKTLLQ